MASGKLVAGIIAALVIGALIGFGVGRLAGPAATTTYTTTTTYTATYTSTATYTTAYTTTVTLTKLYMPYPLAIADALNRTVVFNAPPSTVVSLAPDITQALVALGLCGRIVGLDQYSYQLLSELNLTSCLPKGFEVVEINTMSPTGYNADAILLLRPQLVLADAGFDAMWASSLPSLQKYGITVFFLRGTSAHTIRQIEDDVVVLGNIFGVPEEASAVVGWMNKTLASLPPARPSSVAFVVWVNPDGSFYAAGGGTFIDYEIKAAGGVNALGNYSGWGPFEPSVLLTANPQIIVVTSMGLGDNCTAVRAALSQIPGITGTAAYKSGSIYVVTGMAENAIEEPSVLTIYGVEILHDILAGEAPHCITTQWAIKALNMTLP